MDSSLLKTSFLLFWFNLLFPFGRYIRNTLKFRLLAAILALYFECGNGSLCLSATVPSAESQQECLACVVSACVPFNFSNNFLRHQFCLAVLSHVPVTVPNLSFFMRFQILPIQVILQCCSLISYPPWLTRLQPSDPHLTFNFGYGMTVIRSHDQMIYMPLTVY